MAIITTSTGRVVDTSTVDLAKQAELYSQIKANSTYVPGQGYIPNDRIMSDSRGAWIGGASPQLPTQDMSFMWGGNGEQNPADVASAQETLDRLAATQRGVPTKPGITSTPYPGGRPPVQQSGMSGMSGGPQGGLDTSAIMRAMMPTIQGNRTAFGPGTFAPSYRPMPRVGQTAMPQRPMPVFPGQLTSPYVQADSTGISPQQRGQQAGLSPALMQYLQSLAATFGGTVPQGIFGPAPTYQGSPTFGVPPATTTPPAINMTRQEDVYPTGT